MNRKNLTAALLAGLAGAAGIAGSAQAVNLNPDGLGSVLIYPYYTVNGGNDTLLSVVNTSDDAKAVKVRFVESYNSREVLDFNLYMSAYDVWVAAIVAGTTIEDEIVGVDPDEDGAWLLVPDSSCTTPYLYEWDRPAAFLPYAYQGDGGPNDLSRVREGHFEMIEMGTLVGASAVDATHVASTGEPADCAQLNANWSNGGTWAIEAAANAKDPDEDFADCAYDGTKYVDHCDYATTDVTRNSGGLFGSAAIINGAAGTMYSYDAHAVQGFDDKDRGNHHTPGTSRPSLNSGNVTDAWVFFGEPIVKAVELSYPFGIDAISAVFMHEKVMNEYAVNANIGGLSEWVVTFPTKNWYVDDYTRGTVLEAIIPDPSDPACLGWEDGDDIPNNGNGKWVDSPTNSDLGEWPSIGCDELEITHGREPFTSIFNGDACEKVHVSIWDREESPSTTTGFGPIVSPPPPGGTPPGGTELCYEANVIRFSEDERPDTGSEIFGNVHPKAVTVAPAGISGWAQMDFWLGDSDHEDYAGLVGLPVTGFWANALQNSYAGGELGIIANYGGLFGHKANIRRQGGSYCDRHYCGSGGYGKNGGQ